MQSTRNFPLQQMAKKRQRKRHILRDEKNEANRCPVRSTTGDHMQLVRPRQKLMDLISSFWGWSLVSTRLNMEVSPRDSVSVLTAIITTATITEPTVASM